MSNIYANLNEEEDEVVSNGKVTFSQGNISFKKHHFLVETFPILMKVSGANHQSIAASNFPQSNKTTSRCSAPSAVIHSHKPPSRALALVHLQFDTYCATHNKQQLFKVHD